VERGAAIVTNRMQHGTPMAYRGQDRPRHSQSGVGIYPSTVDGGWAAGPTVPGLAKISEGEFTVRKQRIESGQPSALTGYRRGPVIGPPTVVRFHQGRGLIAAASSDWSGSTRCVVAGSSPSSATRRSAAGFGFAVTRSLRTDTCAGKGTRQWKWDAGRHLPRRPAPS